MAKGSARDTGGLRTSGVSAVLVEVTPERCAQIFPSGLDNLMSIAEGRGSSRRMDLARHVASIGRRALCYRKVLI